MRRRAMNFGARSRVGSLVAVLAATLVGALALSGQAAAEPSDSTAVTIPGSPLTVYVGPRGQCQSSYIVNGLAAGNFYPGFAGENFAQAADCGFFLAFPKTPAEQPAALQGKVAGFNGNAGPFLSLVYEKVEQLPVTGAGTEASPYSQTTVFKVSVEGTDYARVTEVTTYVNGSPQFTSTFTVKNISPSGKIFFRAIYAGDLFVNGADFGTGVVGSAPLFIGGQNNSSGVIGGFQQVPEPALPWSAYQELNYPSVWTHVENAAETAPWNDTIEPNEVDNAAGVEWDQFVTTGIAKNEERSFSIINRTQIPSALQFKPVTQTLTQGQTATINVSAADTAGQPYAGRAVRYSIAGANPQSGSVTLNGAGQAQIAYVGNNPGIDSVHMYVDLANNNEQSTSDPSGTATVTWAPKPPPPTPNASYKVQSIKANSNGTITIVFVPVQGGTATLEVTVPTATITKKKKC